MVERQPGRPAAGHRVPQPSDQRGDQPPASRAGQVAGRWAGAGISLVLCAGIDLMAVDQLTFPGLCALVVPQALYLVHVARGAPRPHWPPRRAPRSYPVRGRIR